MVDKTVVAIWNIIIVVVEREWREERREEKREGRKDDILGEKSRGHLGWWHRMGRKRNGVGSL